SAADRGPFSERRRRRRVDPGASGEPDARENLLAERIGAGAPDEDGVRAGSAVEHDRGGSSGHQERGPGPVDGDGAVPIAVAIAGSVAGAVGAVALTRTMSGLLFGVSSFDVGTFLAMAGVLVAVALLACYIPARRASKVDPLIALRYE